MTWQSLTTYAGSVIATGAVTQFFKEMGLVGRISTRLFSALTALVLLTLAEGFTNGLTPASLAILPLNALIVSFASNGAYDALTAETKRKTSR